jgi:hypothetical protein
MPYREGANGSDRLGRPLKGAIVNTPHVDNDQVGGISSGPPISEFKGGWARLCFVGEKGHYWQPHRKVAGAITSHGATRIYQSLCRAIGTTSNKAPALALGNRPRCKHCQRQANKLRLT